MDLGLKNKVAMVAGASKGLGFAVAKALADEGALVSISSRDSSAITVAAQHINQGGNARAFAFVADVSDADAIAYWHRSTLDKVGPVDLLVTNSGGPPGGNILSFQDAELQDNFELLVLSAIRMIRSVLPSMVANRAGSIVLMTSSSVKEPIAGLGLSNVLRSSVAALAKTLANEYAGQGIRVNHVIPGRLATDRVRMLDDISSKKNNISVEEQQKRSRANIPLGRYGEPEEFGRAVAFLLSNAASYITGATLQVDGGQMRGVL